MNHKEVFEELTLAYYYAAPLIMSHAVAAGKPRNEFVHMPGPADADRKIVARPGVDQVASYAWLDLSTSPIVLTTPSSVSDAYPKGRYLTYQIMDAWTNCVALLGTGFINGNNGGKYVFTGPGFKGETPAEYHRIDCPTDFTIIWSRTFCLDKSEMPEINELKSHFKLEPLFPDKYVEKKAPGFPAKLTGPVAMVASLDMETYFNLFNELARGNDPYAYDKPVLDTIGKYGIGTGLTFSLNQFPEELRQDISENLAQNVISATKGLFHDMPTVNSWHVSTKEVGRYGTNYILRGTCALNGYAANPPEMCMYLTATHDQDGQRLSGKHRYRIHFKNGQLPPILETGYWSLIAYDADGYLMRNPLNRYKLSGWDSNFLYNEDGSLDLYVQHDPPAEKRINNYLPCGEGEMDICLRLYLPLPEARTDKWEPPIICRMD